MLAAGNLICEFRRRHLADFKRLFVEVVRLAAERVANFVHRRAKVRANASKRRRESRMIEEEKREIEALVSRARETDAAEDSSGATSCRGN